MSEPTSNIPDNTEVNSPAGAPAPQELPPYAADPQAYQYAPAPNQAETAGKGLSIAGIICGILIPLVGLILGIIGMNQNKKAGGDGKLGKIAIIVSVVVWILSFIVMMTMR